MTGRSELSVLEQRGHSVEIACVEPERVLVDQRRDLVDVAREVGHGLHRIGIVAQPRTFPECTRVQPPSVIS